jgi:hypothetical protein
MTGHVTSVKKPHFGHFWNANARWSPFYQRSEDYRTLRAVKDPEITPNPISTSWPPFHVGESRARQVENSK